MHYQELSATAQTAYAQLQDAAAAENLRRSVADLRGTFAKKSLKGRDYWYFSFREGAKVYQIYVGPDDERIAKLVRSKREAADSDQTEVLARAYAAHGATTLLPKHLRVINRIADFGFFHAGGVLIGTHAFAGYANMLGLRWTSGDRTMDVDLAMPGKNVSIALPDAPKINLHDALASFEAGFIPTQSLDGRAGPTYVLKGDKDFQVDFLTTHGRAGETAHVIPGLAVTAQPLKFLDYLVEGPVQMVLLDRLGHYCVVTAPAPARYAVHKMIVQGERDMRYRTKARKDLEQAAALIEYLYANDRRTLESAYKDALSRGPGWRKRLKEANAVLATRWPESDAIRRLASLK